jgi:hypothetical protein
MNRQLRSSFLVRIAAALALLLAALPSFGAEPAAVADSSALRAGLSAEEIVARLIVNNQQRAAALHAYEGKRTYVLTYRGFPSNRDAEIEVVAHYVPPGNKRFEVVSGSGSKMIQSKVFLRLLESEREASDAEGQRQTALSPENYKFTLLGSRPSPYGGCYRLWAEPRREDRFLYRGEICVNAADFAVESINAELAKNPSFWIKKTRIEHRYQKIGEFWLSASDQTISSIRLGGMATLSILYSGYKLH